MNEYYTVLLGYGSVLGSVSELGHARAWVIAAHSENRKRPDLDGFQFPSWTGQGVLGRLRGLLATDVSVLSPKGILVKKHENTLSHYRFHHTTFFNVEFLFNYTDETPPCDLFSGTSAGLRRKVNCGEWMLCTFLFKLKMYLLQKVSTSCPCVVLFNLPNPYLI